MDEVDVLASLRSRLPRHAALLDSMSDVVKRDGCWRFLEVGCSLGAGGGDELSDIDAGLGYDGIEVQDLHAAARHFALEIVVPADFIVHRMDGWSEDVCRLAAEYDDGLQLDLVVMPAARRAGLPDRSFAVVDKDERLSVAITPPARLPPSIEVAREWVVLGWWAIATADKYVRRDSLFEAVQAIDEARAHSLRLWAAGHDVPYPAFGLTSLLDFPPYELPPELVATYAVPDDVDAVAAANRATAELLATASVSAGASLGTDIASPLASRLRRRIASSGPAG
jgi:nucleotide-binding universal stress UspA family protein